MSDVKPIDFSISFIGFGEAAMAFVKGWKPNLDIKIKAYDIKTDSRDLSVQKLKSDDYTHTGITGCDNLQAALSGANIIFSLVTADQAYIAAKNAAKYITPDTLFLDCNSCAPETKRKSAKLITQAGGYYVDVAVMAPVHPALHKVPLLLSGPYAVLAAKTLASLNMTAKEVEGGIGAASSVKMMRSIIVKGIEALMLECMLASHKAGVEQIVLDSLEDSYPGFGWKQKAGYMLERVMSHGKRRAAEMREVASTVSQLGFNNRMSNATADWQQKIGNLEFNMDTLSVKNYQKLASLITTRLNEEKVK